MKGSIGVAETVLVMVPLDMTTRVEPKPTPVWFLAPTVVLDMMMACDEGALESDEESYE